MAISAQGGVSGDSPGTPFSSIAKRDRDRAAYMAARSRRQQARNARSHKRGFGTQARSERFA